MADWPGDDYWQGLIKYALQHGYALTPIYSFGENRSFHTYNGLLRLRLWLNRFNFPAVSFFGDPWMPLFPRRDSQCLSYVAPPLVLPTIAQPTAAQIDEWHAKYLEALQVRELISASQISDAISRMQTHEALQVRELIRASQISDAISAARKPMCCC